MSKRDTLERTIIKSVTGPDETKFLLKAVDECIAEELQNSDEKLIAEIDALEIEVLKAKAEADDWSKKYMEIEVQLNSLKSAFKRENAE